MDTKSPRWLEAFNSRDDLKQFGVDALLLFALQLRFGMEDISLIASNSLTDGSDDKKADLVYIDSGMGHAVIAQAYMTSSTTSRKGIPKGGAPSNKASDLNTAVGWLISRPIDDLPINIRPHAEELRQAIQDGVIKSIHIWYVHNLPESTNVQEELATVEHTAKSAIQSCFPGCTEIAIQAVEVGISTLNEWYESISTPILVSEEFAIPISGGFEIDDADWKSYVTSIPAKWLYDVWQSYKTKLLSANVRDYLGSRNADSNINHQIKQTAYSDPNHFWVYNNGITALVHEFKEIKSADKLEIYFRGISIVNGSQTTGVLGTLGEPPEDAAKVQVRFIMCNNAGTLKNIVLYNNSQNKITAPDFRSTDLIQRRLVDEFSNIPSVDYSPRRGGHEDAIKRRPNLLPSVIAGQALAAFHKDPDVAYHERTRMWDDDTLYSKYFNEQTSAIHIIFANSLLESVEKKKVDLLNKSKKDSLTNLEEKQLGFFRKRGSIFLMVSAIARCLEIFLDKQIPNPFKVAFKSNLSPEEATEPWGSIVEIASSFTAPLENGLADGFKNRAAVDAATDIFQSLVASTKAANAGIYATFAEQVM